MAGMMTALSAIWLGSGMAWAGERMSGDDTAGSVNFDMVASLHPVKGQAKSFTAELFLTPQPTGKVVFQARQLTTGLGVRDNRMYNYCLDADRYPTVEFTIRGAAGDVEGLRSRKGSGSLLLKGALKVRSTERDIEVPATYTWTAGQLKLVGSQEIKWTDYGVPDPSIVISRLYPEVAVQFDLQLKESP